MIDVTKLTEEDINKKVAYQAYEGATFEVGKIVGWDEVGVLVQFGDFYSTEHISPVKLTINECKQ